MDCINLLRERIWLTLFCYLKGAGRRKKAAPMCQRELDKYWMAPGLFQSCGLWNPLPAWIALPVGCPSFNAFNFHSLIHTHTHTHTCWGCLRQLAPGRCSATRQVLSPSLGLMSATVSSHPQLSTCLRWQWNTSSWSSRMMQMTRLTSWRGNRNPEPAIPQALVAAGALEVKSEQRNWINDPVTYQSH